MAGNKPAGTPIWVDLATTDLEGAQSFYGKLFGWEFEGVPGMDADSPYIMVKKDGKYSCGMTLVSKGDPASWNTYIRSDDVAADVEKVIAADGKVIADAQEIPEMGTLAVVTDSQGAVFMLWKDASDNDSADAYNQPGFLSWNELAAKDMRAAREFYQKVFSWESEESPGEHLPYTSFTLNGNVVGGGYEINESMGPMPTHWDAYFATTDVNATKDQVEKLGGKVMMGPMSTPAGDCIYVQDPQGAFVIAIELST